MTLSYCFFPDLIYPQLAQDLKVKLCFQVVVYIEFLYVLYDYQIKERNRAFYDSILSFS